MMEKAKLQNSLEKLRKVHYRMKLEYTILEKAAEIKNDVCP